jgi:hypothetical protein
MWTLSSGSVTLRDVDRKTGPDTGQTTEPLTPVEDQEPEPGRPDPSDRSARLAADPRVPVWIRRGVAAAVAGLVVAILLDWRLGLTAAGLVAVADTIYRSKTMAVVPAAALATSAQRRTRRRLIMLRQAGYVTLNTRAIPGSGSVIDHLVIGPGGVVALDSERWDRRLPVRTGTGTQLYHGPFSQKTRLAHARWEAEQASGLLGAELGRGISVQPAMAIYGPTIPWAVASLRGVDVFAGRRVRKYFRRRSRASRRARLSSSQIEAIRAAADQALPPA